jgi:hypothetical protein
LLNVEHYLNNGVLNTIIKGRSAAEIYMTAIDLAPRTLPGLPMMIQAVWERGKKSL